MTGTAVDDVAVTSSEDAVKVFMPYPAGVDGGRTIAVYVAHQRLTAAVSGGGLCDVLHAVDLETWQVPRDVRAQVQRTARALSRRRKGQVVLLVRCWQHRGACPDATPDGAS